MPLCFVDLPLFTEPINYCLFVPDCNCDDIDVRGLNFEFYHIAPSDETTISGIYRYISCVDTRCDTPSLGWLSLGYRDMCCGILGLCAPIVTPRVWDGSHLAAAYSNGYAQVFTPCG